MGFVTGDRVFGAAADNDEDDERIATAGDVLASLQRLEDNLDRFKRAQSDFAVCFQAAMAPCRIPSKLRQRCVFLRL